MDNRDTDNTAKDKNTALSYDDVLEMLDEISINLESYNDYPKGASNNAKGQLNIRKRTERLAVRVSGGLEPDN